MFNSSKNVKRTVCITAAAACMLSAMKFLPIKDDYTMAAETLTAFEITEEMKIGWNYGNCMDATVSGSTATVDSETAWGNPKATQEMVDALKAKGFNTLRIPTTWYQHLDADNNIDPEWMARVHEIVDYAYKNDMYVILNLHHEEWVNRADLGTAYDEMKPKLLKIWQQIADEFTDYDQHLIFECMNEPRAVGTDHEWWGPQQNEVDTINNLNADFVELIRNDDSPYADTRLLMIPGYCASSDITIIPRIVVPEDDYVAVSIHAYSPYNFTMNAAVSDHSTFTDAYAAELSSILEGIRSTFIEKDIPVVIGEFSASNYDNTEARCEWAELYISTAKSIGVPCVLWDNDARGNTDKSERHDYLDRNTLQWYEDSGQVVDTMMSVLADESIPWGGARLGVQYDHNDIDSGENLYDNASGIKLDASSDTYVSQNFDFSLSDLVGKEVAVEFTGDTPSLALMDGAWGGWTEILPYDVENGIAYYSYDSIKSAWSSSTEPEHMCFKATGVTTITQISVIDAAEVGEAPTEAPTEESTEAPTEEATEGETEAATDDAFVFEQLSYTVDLPEGSKEGATLSFDIDGTAGASVGGGLGYGTNADDWVNIEWSTNIDSDGTAVVTIDLSDVPEDITSAQIQVWWSNLWNAAEEVAYDQPCEMVHYEISMTSGGEIVYGDANMDGMVDINDAVLLMSYLANKDKYPLSTEQIITGDVYQTGDGISIGDANSIQKYLAKMISVLPES